MSLIDQTPIVLASASPRRRQLLAQLGVHCRVVAPNIDETVFDFEDAETYVLRIARQKAEAASTAEMVSEADVIIAADTCIELDATIFGKPRDVNDAQAMLRRLSGREHRVLSAVCVYENRRQQCRMSRNRVRFRKLTAAEISAYCRSGEPLDKAGAYAVQGKAAMFISEIHGSYRAIMGLPLFELSELLALIGINVME